MPPPPPRPAPWPSAGHRPPPGYGSLPPRRGPHLLWIAPAWALFAVLTMVAIGGLVTAVSAARPHTAFAAGELVTTTLDPADRPALLASAERPTDIVCRIRDRAGSTASLSRPGDGTGVSVDGWELAFRIDVPRRGEYDLLCDGHGATFGIAGEPAVRAVAPWADRLLMMPGAGFLLAVAVTAAVLLARRRRGW